MGSDARQELRDFVDEGRLRDAVYSGLSEEAQDLLLDAVGRFLSGRRQKADEALERSNIESRVVNAAMRKFELQRYSGPALISKDAEDELERDLHFACLSLHTTGYKTTGAD